MAANRARHLAGRAEKLGSLEGFVVTLIAHGPIFGVEHSEVKMSGRFLFRKPPVFVGLSLGEGDFLSDDRHG